MRLAFANVLALVAYVGVIWTCFSFLLGFATNPMVPLGFTVELNKGTFGFAIIDMVVVAPVALLIMLIYFAMLRTGPLAIVALAVVAIALSIAFMSPLLHLGGWPGGPHDSVREWIGVVWAGVTAALAHHIVFALFRPRKG